MFIFFCSAAKASCNVATICGHVGCVCVYIYMVVRHRLLTQKSSVTSLKCCSLFESASCLSSLTALWDNRTQGQQTDGRKDGRTSPYLVLCHRHRNIFEIQRVNPVFPSLCTRACTTSLLGNFNGFAQLSIFISEMNDRK